MKSSVAPLALIPPPAPQMSLSCCGLAFSELHLHQQPPSVVNRSWRYAWTHDDSVSWPFLVSLCLRRQHLAKLRELIRAARFHAWSRVNGTRCRGVVQEHHHHHKKHTYSMYMYIHTHMYMYIIYINTFMYAASVVKKWARRHVFRCPTVQKCRCFTSLK